MIAVICTTIVCVTAFLCVAVIVIKWILYRQQRKL